MAIGLLLPWGSERCRGTHRSIAADYEITSKVLGVGLGGDVVEAIHRTTGRRVAVKSFDLRTMNDRCLTDLHREIAVQTSLSHGNIARLEAVCSSPGNIHVCIEGMSGNDLFDHLMEQSRLTEAETANILTQLLDAMEYMHSQNVVHRDIKPENLVYVAADKKHVKLIDFGFAKAWDGETPMRRTCGTDGYRAPEVVQGSYTIKADLWSVGVVAHVLLTGDLTGRNTNWTPRFSERFGDLSSEAQAFIKSLLQRNPAKRPSAAQMRKHPWLLHHQARANIDCSPPPLTEMPLATLHSGKALDMTLSQQWMTHPSACASIKPQKASTTSWWKKTQLLKVPLKMPGAFKAAFGMKKSRVFVTTPVVPDGSG